MDVDGNIRLVVKYLGERTELCYYDGDEKIAAEVLESDRIVLKQGVIPDGTVVEYYPGGTVKRMSRYHNQKPEGRSVIYYPTGELWEEQHFKEGKLEGLCAMYRKNGTLWCESSYAEGRLHGPFKSYHENGQIESFERDNAGRTNYPLFGQSGETAG